MSEEWTVDNGLLTPTLELKLELKRSAIEARYGTQVDDWYASKDTIVWA